MDDNFTIQGGTGTKLTRATTIVAGVASLIATLLSIVSILLQAKNYRKPLLQRYVVRILLMVPIYSISSFTSMVSLKAAAFVDPVRDIYEAFTIYTFFQLLINYLSGERALIIMTHGRAPVQHLWPLNYVLPKVDISDPHTFLAIKRGILQYAWLKPLLAFATIFMKATGTYQEGYLAVTSGYLWTGIIYNISVTLSLYCLGLFWVCTHDDLEKFRPVPKFLCIKLIIFASYWQGFFLSILVWVGAIPDNVDGYTQDNLAAAIQDALICVEMPIFAIAHWYAFKWQDFADNSILSARMPVKHAFRDAFGARDLIEDSKETLRGDNYGYRIFDSGDKVMAHEDSKSRLARLSEGMRYERGGKSKYWIPKPGEVNTTTPLLHSNAHTNSNDGDPSSSNRPDQINENTHGTFEDPEVDSEEETLYGKARQLEYGDWNYPVITASEPLRERYLSSTGNFGLRPPRIHSPRTAGSASSSSKATSQSKGAVKGKDAENPVPKSTEAPEAETVVSVKKKKKSKKTAKHPKPAANPPADSHEGPGEPSNEPQVSSQAAGPSAQGEASPISEEAGHWEGERSVNNPQRQYDYSPYDDGEFRNVWGGDEGSK